MFRISAQLAILSALLACGPADSANISLAGAVANVCLLTVTTPGIITVSSSGTALSSDNSGGLPATMTVAATGTSPTITLTAPQLNGPSASTGGATTTMAITSPGGANQSYTGGAWNYAMTRLNDTLTIRGQANNPAGFVTGSYSITSVATCQQ